jgi:putative intracellular protease/amidase
MNILMVLTSHSMLGTTGKKTGFWIEEFAGPYYVFKQAGATITLASPLGGQPPIDPTSDDVDNQTPATIKFKADHDVLQAMANTKVLATLSANDYDAVFFPGGHGPLWDLTNNAPSIAIIENFLTQGKPVAAVCHAPAALLHVKNKDGELMLKNKKVTGFSNAEEKAVNLTNVVPFLLEDALKKAGAIYTKKEDWAIYAVQDGLLITGQNPASSEKVAEMLLNTLTNK